MTIKCVCACVCLVGVLLGASNAMPLVFYFYFFTAFFFNASACCAMYTNCVLSPNGMLFVYIYALVHRSNCINVIKGHRNPNAFFIAHPSLP